MQVPLSVNNEGRVSDGASADLMSPFHVMFVIASGDQFLHCLFFKNFEIYTFVLPLKICHWYLLLKVTIRTVSQLALA